MSGSSSQQQSESENNSSSIGIGGDNNGYVIDGSGNTFNTTDYGAVNDALSFAQNFGNSALETVVNSNDNMANVANNGMSLADSLGHGAFGLVDGVTSSNAELANSAINSNAALVGQYGDLSALMLDRTLSSSESVFSDGAQMLDNQADRNLSAALAVTETGAYQQQMGYDFARDLFSQNGEAAIMQQQNNNDALGNGFKSMMQFADSFSRSDGNAVAETNMKTVGLLSLAAIGVAFALRKGK